MKKLALILALFATPLQAQTAAELAAKARTDANTAENALGRVLTALDKLIKLLSAPPPPVFVPTPSKVGEVQPIASGLALSTMVQAGAMPPSSPDEPAFRFICMPGHLSYDDPIVYPGQPGKAHLHQFFGNTLANAMSTYKSLRTTGDSTCMSTGNRSAYWMPAMLDGKGNVVRPDFLEVYYKGSGAGNPGCSKLGYGGTGGECVKLPIGLRYVFGWDQTRPEVKQATTANFKCINGNSLVGPVSIDMVEPAKACKPGMQLYAVVIAPNCWDGVNLDSLDHRSHMAYMGYGDWGVPRCPAGYPKIIPTFQMLAVFSVKAGDDPTKWTFSSDHMIPEAIRRPGASFHSDWFGAWEPEVQKMWEDNCIGRSLNCSAGVLGNGQMLKQNFPFSWIAEPHLAPMPVQPS